MAEKSKKPAKKGARGIPIRRTGKKQPVKNARVGGNGRPTKKKAAKKKADKKKNKPLIA